MTIKNIHIYELPDEENAKAFQIFEVQGKKIEDQNYPHNTDRPHRHNYYEICVFVTGAGKHEIDFKLFPIASQSIHFLSPGQVHLISREENYHGFLIMFSREFYSSDFIKKDMLFDLPYFNNNTSKPILDLENREFIEFLEIIKTMIRENAHDYELRANILRSYLHIFLLKCKAAFLEQRTTTTSVADISYITVNQFKILIEKCYKELHFVREYAELLALSPVQLNKMVKQITGKNASDMIINRIILEAKRLLNFTELSNKEIAYQMNYEDPSYFSRIFRKKTGITPSDFRNNLQKKYQT